MVWSNEDDRTNGGTMKVAVFGTGMVGQALAGKLGELGHTVVVGTRDVDAARQRADGRAPFGPWIADHPDVAVETFAAAARDAEMIFNATSGEGSIEALKLAGGDLDGKIIVDVSNALDSSSGFPPSFFVANTDSLGEQIQRAFPDAKVVKALNTVTAAVMVAPGTVANGEHDIFVCGNDDGAKAEVSHLLTEGFGWKRVTDLGDITNARATEMYLALWLRLMGNIGTNMFNIKVVR